MADYTSKHGIVSKTPFELYMMFADMRNFVQFLPDDKKQDVQADYNTIKATVQNFNIGARVDSRMPYSRIVYKDDGAPFPFTLTLHFDAAGTSNQTDFFIEASADLNFMMKMMIGNKIKDGLDKIVDGLVAVSQGRMPDGIDPSMMNWPGSSN